MANEVTNIDDVIVPAIWLPYAIQRSVELSVFHRSGIIVQDAEFAALVDAERGTQVDMPFWNDLTGKAQVIHPTNPLETSQITASQDKAQIHNYGGAWSTHDLAKFFAGSDPAAAIGDLVGEWWARDIQARLLSSLTGVFAAANMNTQFAHIYHTTGGAGSASALNYFNAETFIDACQILGDHKKSLTAVAMHSAVHASIEKQGLIDTIPDDQGRPINYFRGLEIIIDDNMPTEVVDGDVVYTSYIFGKGAFAMGVGNNNSKEQGMSPGSSWQLEYTRDGLAHVSTMINRRRWILHPRGVKWTAASLAVPSGATFAELETASNWIRVYDPKNVRMIQFKTNII